MREPKEAYLRFSIQGQTDSLRQLKGIREGLDEQAAEEVIYVQPCQSEGGTTMLQLYHTSVTDK